MSNTNRNKKVTIRFRDDEEYDNIRRNANAAGESVSGYIRRRALEEPIQFFDEKKTNIYVIMLDIKDKVLDLEKQYSDEKLNEIKERLEDACYELL